MVPPDWSGVYHHPQFPLHLDIGCGRGSFLLEMAQLHHHWNFLGVEIRQTLVAAANHHRTELGLTNLHYLFCNVNPSLVGLLTSLPSSLSFVSIQFPDPWFKKRHQKRRVVQPELVDTLGRYLKPGGVVFLQSDVREVAIDMADQFAFHPAFSLEGGETLPQKADDGQWILINPLPVATERERSTLERGGFVYRQLFKKIN